MAFNIFNNINKKNPVKDQHQLAEEQIYTASQWELMWRKFKKHKLAMASGIIILILYLIAIFAPVIAPHDPYLYNRDLIFVPPQKINFVDQEEGFSLRPFVYGLTKKVDPKTWQRVYEIDKAKKYPVYFMTEGFEYRLFGFFKTNIHLFGVKEGNILLLGTDKLGRDVFSKMVYGARISMSIGLLGIFISFVLGLFFGGLSGYYGGLVDEFIQRAIEIIRSFPTIPLWMALTAALPQDWSPITVYFMVVLIISLIGWTSLARRVRGKFLSLREEDYTKAAKLAGGNEFYIIRRHFIPSFMSFIIASLTLRIPAMILAETSLSFLGIGLRPPTISWGVLLQEAQNINSVALHPWLFTPAILVILTVLSFNFLGDGLRDAADPYN